MVVEEASILSPASTDRAMASDSPARSLDEIDLSALRWLVKRSDVRSMAAWARMAASAEKWARPRPLPRGEVQRAHHAVHGPLRLVLHAPVEGRHVVQHPGRRVLEHTRHTHTQAVGGRREGSGAPRGEAARPSRRTLSSSCWMRWPTSSTLRPRRWDSELKMGSSLESSGEVRFARSCTPCNGERRPRSGM
ncbi:hypothetical protein EYF80_038491 [Liparis tanakae]|uniref:Uncharacterized protein n=1 Tax=Liparis tanakae TaxID=230148 RepID=A0A4Z2GCP0_9TELE|nr:hypothetical protein EYF80_038491 [Liparis tanakae]